MVRSRSRIVILSFLLMAGTSCEESLPGYDDPSRVFDAQMEGVYFINRTDNSFKVYMSLVNRFDETLDARALLDGQVTIVWMRDPTFRRTMTVTAANLIYAPKYNPNTGVLTVDAGDSIRLGVSWNLVSDNGDSLKRKLTYHPDPTCPARMISEPVLLHLSGELKVYERTGIHIAVPRQVWFEHTREYVDPRACG